MAIETKAQWQARRDAAVAQGNRKMGMELDRLGYEQDYGVGYGRDMVPDWVEPTTASGTGTGTAPAVATGQTEADNTAENIRIAMSNIGNLFAGRQGVYDRLKNSSYALSQRGIEDSYQDALRQLNFRMHKQGLDAGKVDIDLRTGLAEQKTESLADALIAASNLAGKLQSADSTKRARLEQMAGTGKYEPGIITQNQTFDTGVPQAWQGIGDIGWRVPTGFMPHAFEGQAAPRYGNPYYVKGTSGVSS